MKCINCGNIINDGGQYCPECGYKIERNCINCGTKLSDKDIFCPACGRKQIVVSNIIEEQQATGQEKMQNSLIDQIINGVLSLQELKGLTDDTYRNGLVKRVFVYNVAVLIITISAFFFVISYLRSIIFWDCSRCIFCDPDFCKYYWLDI